MGAHCDAAAWVPGTGQRCVRVVVGVGLVLTGRTECTDDVVLVGCTIAVFDDDPETGVSVAVGGVATDLEQLGQGAVEQRCRDGVARLVNTCAGGLTVNRDVAESTEVNHRRVGTRRGHIVSTVSCVSRGVRTVVAVQVNIDQHNIGSGTGLGHFNGSAADA